MGTWLAAHFSRRVPSLLNSKPASASGASLPEEIPEETGCLYGCFYHTGNPSSQNRFYPPASLCLQSIPCTAYPLYSCKWHPAQKTEVKHQILIQFYHVNNQKALFCMSIFTSVYKQTRNAAPLSFALLVRSK